MNEYKNAKLKSLLSAAVYLLVMSLAFMFGAKSLKPPEVEAQTSNYACIGNALAQYMNQVIETTKTSGLPMRNVKLLSPAFNMTNPNGSAIASAMLQSGANFAGVAGIAGNAYNCCSYAAAPNGWITEHVDAFRLATGLQSRVLITETGVFDGDVGDLKREMDEIQLDPSYIGALLFNAFNTNGEWERFSFPDNATIKNQVCGESCYKLGVNSATFYPESTEFYDRARDLRVDGERFFTLSISNADESTLEGVILALQRGLTPVIRIGTTHAAGPDAIGYAQFLKALDEHPEVNGLVYAIAGPNEPQSECWAAPECGCDLSPFDPDGLNVNRPVEKGFYLGKYSCRIDDVADPEFHALRPYPASSCDLLIPMSDPEAPNNTIDTYEDTYDEKADFQKYNTFACGSSLDFEHVEVFEPYGNYDGTIIADSFGNEYLHTYCDFGSVPDDQLHSTGYFNLTCYRSVGYEVYADFSDSNLGILGNTQSTKLSEENKLNNYLSYYFTGTTQIADRTLLDPDEPEEIGRMVNFSGPIRRLLPWDAIQLVRGVLIDAVKEETNDIHNYALNDQRTIRMNTINTTLEQFFPNIPNSSLEDVAGEAILTTYGPPGDAPFTLPSSPENPNPLGTAPPSFTIICGVGAHEFCPSGSAGVVGGGGPGGGPGGDGGNPSCVPNGSCETPFDYCCGSRVFDLSCHTTESRCVASASCTPTGRCLAPGETCCVNEKFDTSCHTTETRCVY